MKKYLFRFNKDLLELGALEMDEALQEVLAGHIEGQESVAFTNESVSRQFKLNWEEGTLEGRGIKGFFAPFTSQYLWIEPTNDNQFYITAPPKPPKQLDDYAPTVEEQEHLSHVLDAMGNFQQDHEKWFQLYQLEKDLTLDSNQDQLISLPYVRDLDTYDYQINTVKSVLNRFKGRALLSDEVGLGKTIEAGLAMMEYIMRGLARRILILCPPSLVTQWHDEMKRKFNQDFIRADDPAFKKQGEAAWAQYDKVIASISLAKRKNHRTAIEQQYYDLAIVDEAHHVKNRKTKAWQFVNAINKKYIFLLTATPVQNHMEELYNLITLLKPGQLKTYSQFRKNFVKDKQGIEAKNVDTLKSLLSDVMIRNKRSNVDVRFTKRTAWTHTVSLSDEERDLYQDMTTFIRQKYEQENPTITRFQLKHLQEQMGSSFFTLSSSLKNWTNRENLSDFDRKKLKRFSEQAEDLAGREDSIDGKVQELISILTRFGDKMIVFTKYKTTLHFLADILRNQDFQVAVFHGGLRRKEKEDQVDFFRSGADVLVCTEVGGEGRNLQFCNGMVNFDLPWNPMAIEQRIGRIHRIGQTRDVFVYNLVAQHTLESYILHLLDRKINMFELIVGEVDMILGDIEEKEDFSEQMMKAWAESNTNQEVEEKLDDIGEGLLENKKKLMQQKKLDDRLF